MHFIELFIVTQYICYYITFSYLILRDVKQCDNKHRFCATCVFAWSMTYGANSDKCPVCRSKQTEYSDDDKYNQEILNCWVKCPEAGCALRCTLQDFLRHSHGMKLYESSSVTALERAKLTRRPAPVNSFVGGTGFVLLPSVLPDQGQGRQTAQGSIREVLNKKATRLHYLKFL